MSKYNVVSNWFKPKKKRTICLKCGKEFLTELSVAGRQVFWTCENCRETNKNIFPGFGEEV